MNLLLLFAVFSTLSHLSTANDLPFTIEDVYVPENCDAIAAPSDHLMIEYQIMFQNKSIGMSLKSPSQLFHLVLDSKVILYLHMNEPTINNRVYVCFSI